MLSRIVLLATFVAVVSATTPNCGGSCHNLAYCMFDGGGDPVCICSPGTIDKSETTKGTDCDKHGFSVRYVRTLSSLDPNTEGELGSDDLENYCEGSAQGVYVRAIDSVLGTRVQRNSRDVLEVNCLYPVEPNASTFALYSTMPKLCATEPDGGTKCRTDPAVYAWTLPSTDSPLQIPPTGMVLESVNFKPNCAESGCWVLKGTMTTGEAWNTFQVFNTWFLPQADITADHPTGDISYDYDYGAVEWTFEPASHPCTSVNYLAGESTNNQISTCCIDDPGIGQGGGFVPNYRPTQAFVDWAEDLKCDEQFVDERGVEVCWKYYAQDVTWQTASLQCKAAGGYLATIANETENDRMLDLIRRRGLGSPGAWIGLSDDKNESVWEWVDGSPLVYQNWDENNPENADEQCRLYNETYPDYHFLFYICDPENYGWMKASDGEWRSQQNNDGRHEWIPFVCEFDPPACLSHVIQRPDYSAPDPNPDTCWEVQSDELPWSEAQAACGERGGSLVTIKNLEQHFFFRRVLQEGGLQRAWIGLNDLAEEGTMTWASTGEELDAEYWGPALYHNYYNLYETLYEREYEYNYTTYEWDLYYSYERGSLDDPYRYFEDNAEIFDCFYYDKLDASWVMESCYQEYAYVCQLPRANAVTCHSDLVKREDDFFDIAFPLEYDTFLAPGKFKGMPDSPGVVEFTNLDPFFGQFAFEIHLDAVELRTKAGKLRGTVGVEHTVDTYLGLANFRPTGIAALDTFATQTAIHLEKTSFFSVSTHGTNDYTFLEYVNMRLVTVWKEDADFSGVEESADRTVRTENDKCGCGKAAYVQVTFTLGSQYHPNLDSGGLIPIDSVRAGKGTFLEAVEDGDGMEHVCVEYDSHRFIEPDDRRDIEPIGLNGYRGDYDNFNELVAQRCGPQATMCASPKKLEDSFVSYNIPLGFEVFEDASDELDQNIFVSLVVNAVDVEAPYENAPGMAPNDGGAPYQMKTTLTASIPIVQGGVNIFCDGFTAKTDLKDVANADIVVGTASSCTEFTRLRVMQDIASTDLSYVPASRIDSDSIEAAMMTLVIKGNSSFFGGAGRNTLDFTVELDDVITLHLMEDGQARAASAPGDGSREGEVMRLLAIAGDDNSDSNGLDTDGYALNGAFFFTIDRVANTASLEPSPELLAVCPFNPSRPAAGNAELETCVLRRDVRARGYPARVGAPATAMEIAAAPSAKDSTLAATSLLVSGGLDADTSAESAFLTTVLGDSAYTRQLAVDFVGAIHCKYDLNGRYRRAYWINPGYEWSPTQTAGTPIFSVSQKLYLFALVSLSENWGARRRVLLQTTQDPMAEQSAGMNQAVVESEVSRKSLFAKAFEVPLDRVAQFEVAMQLTAAEACMEPLLLQDSLRETLKEYLTTTASAFKTVQVLGMTVDRGQETCGRRALRQLRSAASPFSTASATLQMLIVFDVGTTSTFNDKAFAEKPGITSVVADAQNSPRVTYSESYWCVGDDCGETFEDEEEEEEESGGSKTVPIIAGVCGGVLALLALAVGVMVIRRNQHEAPIEAIHVMNVDDLKSEVHGNLSF